MAIFQGVRAGFVTLAGGCIHGCRKGFCPDADGAPNFVFSLLRGPYNHRRGSSPGIVFSSVARFLGVLETKEFVTNLPPPTLRAGYGSPFLFGTVFVPRPLPSDILSPSHTLSLSSFLCIVVPRLANFSSWIGADVCSRSSIPLIFGPGRY